MEELTAYYHQYQYQSHMYMIYINKIIIRLLKKIASLTVRIHPSFQPKKSACHGPASGQAAPAQRGPQTRWAPSVVATQAGVRDSSQHYPIDRAVTPIGWGKTAQNL
jgi:hypothetical protein